MIVKASESTRNYPFNSLLMLKTHKNINSPETVPSTDCSYWQKKIIKRYGDVIMDTMASQVTSLAIVYSTGYSGADQRKHQSSASPAFVRGIPRTNGQ